MDWMLVVMLAMQRPDGSEQTVTRRESVRSEIACHTAIMRHLDTRGQRVVEAECIDRRGPRAAPAAAGGSMRVAVDTVAPTSAR